MAHAGYHAPPNNLPRSRRFAPLWRALIEAASILFLFYSNLLMGEFTAANSAHGKTLMFALGDIFTMMNFKIGLIAALVGYLAFEFLRRKL